MIAARTGSEVPTPAQLEALARAVSDDGLVRLLVVDDAWKKQPGGWVDLSEATANYEPFMVHVRPDILALDADGDRRIRALGNLAKRLQQDGVVPVVTCSGRGHHLFAWVPDRGTLQYWGEEAKKHGIDWRHDGSPIRPPLSPHPEGLPVGLIDMTIEEAIDALRGCRSAYRPKLTAKLHRLLVDGWTDGSRYASPSEAVQAVATGCVNAGIGYAWFKKAMTNPSNRLAQQSMAKHDDAWLRRTWDRAEEYVARNPPRIPEQRLTAQLKMIETCALDKLPQCRAVLSQHLAAAAKAGRFQYPLSLDDCALGAGVSPNTARTHQRSLEASGLLHRAERGDGRRVSIWELRLPEPAQVRVNERDEHWNRAEWAPSYTSTDYGIDAFRWRAGGKRGPDLIAVLARAHTALSVKELAKRMPGSPSESTVRRLVKKFAAEGAVVQENARGGWLLVDDSAERLDRIAAAHGQKGKRESEQRRVAREKAARADAWRRRREDQSSSLGGPSSDGPDVGRRSA